MKCMKIEVIAENAGHSPKNILSNQQLRGNSTMTSTTQEELRSLCWGIKMIQKVCQKRMCSPDSANKYKRVCIEFTLSFQCLAVAH